MPNLAAAYVALAVAYPLLAHWESHGGGAPAAALALVDLALMMLLEPLMQRRVWAWAVLVLVLGTLAAVMHEPWLPMLLLAPPALFTGWLAWVFARTLRPPRQPLITRIAVALEFDAPEQMPPEQRRYTRTLTGAWAGMLAALTLANLLLALIAEPHGVLVRLGHPPLVSVSQQAWSWFANLFNYGAVAAFFVIEWLLRGHLLPERQRQRPGMVLQRLRTLGLPFWTTLLR
jgi:uncharacterized membrane protein